MNPNSPSEGHAVSPTRPASTDLCARAENEGWTYRDFLAVLVAEEVAHRKQTRVQRLVRRARFPFLKTVDDFDFTFQSTLRLQMLGSCLSPDFVTNGRPLILSGRSGRGKTHLAVAIPYRATQSGFEALFTTCAALVDDLSRAGRDGRILEALVPYTHPHVLVIDEVGYLTYGPDAANVLFHVVNERHLRRRSMVFTTNKPLAAWGRVLHDQDLAAAILDRVLERGKLLELDGPSLRTRHSALTIPPPPGYHPDRPSFRNSPARVSGAHSILRRSRDLSEVRARRRGAGCVARIGEAVARILVIDDDAGYQAAMRRALVLEGHDVRVAGGGEEGLAMLALAAADLVIVDLLMPGMDGIQTVRTLRARFPGVRVLAVTGAHDLLAEDVPRGASWLGDACTMTKPFGDAHLLRTVRALLGGAAL